MTWYSRENAAERAGVEPNYLVRLVDLGILTPEVRRNGLGGIDPARFDKSIEQIAEDFKFHKRPTAADIFDDSFLPPLNGRLIN